MANQTSGDAKCHDALSLAYRYPLAETVATYAYALGMLVFGLNLLRKCSDPDPSFLTVSSPILFTTLMVVGSLLASRKSTLAFDSTGFSCRWWFRRARFDYSKIADVRLYLDECFFGRQMTSGIELLLKSGGVVRFPISARTGMSALDECRPALRTLLAKLYAARNARNSEIEARLERGAADPAQWYQSLRLIGRESSGYRSPSVDTSSLLDVARNPGVPPRLRVAAMAALAVRGADTRQQLSAIVDDREIREAAEMLAVESQEEADREKAAVRVLRKYVDHDD